MALRQNQIASIKPAVPIKLLSLLRQYRMPLIMGGVIITGIMLAVAIEAGLRKNADLKASALFAQAKTAEDYQMILAKVPRSYLTFDILITLGNLSQGQGERDKAMQYYEKALRARPAGSQGAAALCAMGMLSLENKAYAEAAGYFEKSANLQPQGVKAPEALFQWGRTLQAAGDRAGAKQKYESVMHAFPGTPWAREADSKLRRVESAEAK